MAKVMGYQGLLYYGTAGSTAATQITARIDVDYEVGVEVGSTTSAGDGSSVPIKTGEATILDPNLTFTMIVADDDSAIVTLLAAATAGSAVALRYIRASGLLGIDGDAILTAKQGSPLNGEATIEFSTSAFKTIRGLNT